MTMDWENTDMEDKRMDQQNTEAPQQAGKPGKGKAKKDIKTEIREWVVALGVAILVVVVLQSFLFRIIRVDGESMETTLHDGERLFVDVASVKFSETVPRESIVICNYPDRYSSFLFFKYKTFFVKRVVGMPGDQVYREKGVTHVVYEEDGKTVDEMLDDRYAMYFVDGSPDDYEAYTLGEDEYFVVGDNRYNSHDSRDWNDGDPSRDVGPISKDMIIGRVREVIWPLNRIRAAK